MRPFSIYTLEGNWVADRSRAGPALKGGLSDFGFREFTTTAKESYVTPSERPEASRFGKRKLRSGMVTPDTLTEAAYSYGEGLPPQLRFDATSTAAAGKAMALRADAVPFPSTTTAREGMAVPTAFAEGAAARAAADSSHLYYSALAPPAGGGGSLRIDRGKKSLRKPGEPLQLGAHVTEYPTREVHVSVAAATTDLSYMSLQVPSASPGAETAVKRAGPGATHGRSAAFQAAPRVVTNVTATQAETALRPGRRIFADE